MTMPRFRAAAAHVAPVFLDTDATVTKACDLIDEAARAGAELIAFPESFLPGFPLWAGAQAPVHGHELFKALCESAVRIDGPELARIRKRARKAGIFVSLGLTEGTDRSLGCLWNSNVLIGDDGSLLNHHRKLVPTFFEKLIWANGDGRGLCVVPTRIGRIGALICGENTNPLARFSLMAQGEQVHVATFPTVWPTHPTGSGGAYDLAEAIRIRAGAHSFEAKVFTVVSSLVYDATARRRLAPLGPDVLELLEGCPRSVSMIIGPDGATISDVLKGDDEGIAYADIDIARIVELKQLHDVVGYYNRFDVFHMTVNRGAQEPAVFRDEPDERSGVGTRDGVSREPGAYGRHDGAEPLPSGLGVGI